MAAITINFAVLSMVFALIAIRPHRYKSKNSLLYTSTLKNMSQDTYVEMMNDLLNSDDKIYDYIIIDLYKLGQCVKSRQNSIYISIAVIIVGLAINFTYSYLNI